MMAPETHRSAIHRNSNADVIFDAQLLGHGSVAEEVRRDDHRVKTL